MKARRARRNRKGSIIAEMAISIPMIMIMASFLVDCTVMLQASRLADLACRDAARAAAEVETKEDAIKAAEAVMQRYQMDSPLFLKPALAKRRGVPLVEYDSMEGDASSQKVPFVRVTAEVKAKLPVDLPKWKALKKQRRLTFHQTYAFPIVKLELPPEFSKSG